MNRKVDTPLINITGYNRNGAWVIALSSFLFVLCPFYPINCDSFGLMTANIRYRGRDDTRPASHVAHWRWLQRTHNFAAESPCQSGWGRTGSSPAAASRCACGPSQMRTSGPWFPGCPGCWRPLHSSAAGEPSQLARVSPPSAGLSGPSVGDGQDGHTTGAELSKTLYSSVLSWQFPLAFTACHRLMFSVLGKKALTKKKRHLMVEIDPVFQSLFCVILHFP